jgi:TPR repeat protein
MSFIESTLYTIIMSIHKKEEIYNLSCPITILKLASQNNNSDAMVKLAVCYEQGSSVDKNITFAISLCMKAANLNNITAMIRTGIYIIDRKYKQHYKKACNMLEYASNQGWACASFRLAHYHGDDECTKINYKKSLQLYKKAVSDMKGWDISDLHRKALYNIGLYYECGYGTHIDYTKSFNWYQRASDAGDMDATVKVGLSYYNGRGTEKNMNRAFEIFNNVVSQSMAYTQAIYMLGLCYYYGEGVIQDYKKAVELFRITTQRDHIPSCYMLGMCYRDGLGVEYNPYMIIKYLTPAAEKNYLNSVDGLWQFISYKLKEEPEYINILKYGVSLGCAIAMSKLGFHYYDGTEVDKDIKYALTLYNRAIAKNWSEAYNDLGYHYEIIGDHKKAFELFNTAMNLSDKKNIGIGAIYNMSLFYKKGRIVDKDLIKSIQLCISINNNPFIEKKLCDIQVKCPICRQQTTIHSITDTKRLDDDILCIICMTNKPDVVFRGINNKCCHNIFCIQCYIDYMLRTHPDYDKVNEV